MLFLAKVQFAHTFHFVANRLEIAGTAIGGHALKDLGQGHRNVIDVLRALGKSRKVSVGGGDEQQLDIENIGILLVLTNKGVADFFKADPITNGFLTDANLFAVTFRGGADHITLGENMIFDKIHVLNGTECLFGIILIVAFNIAYAQERYAGIGGIGLQLVLIRTVNQNLILIHQLGAGGDTGEIDSRLMIAA